MPDMGIGSILSAGASIGGALMAGDKSAGAATDAARIQAEGGDRAIATQKQMYDQTRADLAPYRGAGQAALYKLSDYLGITPASTFDQAGYDDAMRVWNTVPGGQVGNAPTREQWTTAPPAPSADFGVGRAPFSFDISKDPGYQFRMDQGNMAVENSAAARGSQLSGATLKELLKFGSDYASGEYNAAFNRDLATKNQTYGMLSGMAGMGSGATNVGVNAGATAAGNIGNTQTGIANAQAAGTVGAANAFGGALSGATNAVSQQMLLSSIMKNQNPGVAAVNNGVQLGSGPDYNPSVPV